MQRLTAQDCGDTISVVALVRNEERYVVMYTRENRSAAIQQLARWAANAELSFTWYDAAVLSQKIRGEA